MVRAGQGLCAFPATGFAPEMLGKGHRRISLPSAEANCSSSCGRSGVTPGKVSGGHREEGAVWSSWSDDLGPGASLEGKAEGFGAAQPIPACPCLSLSSNSH